MFGTFTEDLGILEQIINCGRWVTREEIENKFRKITACNKLVQFPLNKKAYYSKLAPANLTGLLVSSYLQSVSVPVLNVYRVQFLVRNSSTTSSRGPDI
jgi:hypothetical protein